MTIIIKKKKKKNIRHRKKKMSSVMGVEPTNVWSGVQHHSHCEVLQFQIKHKYKRRVDQAAKRYAVRVLLI